MDPKSSAAFFTLAGVVMKRKHLDPLIEIWSEWPISIQILRPTIWFLLVIVWKTSLPGELSTSSENY